MERTSSLSWLSGSGDVSLMAQGRRYSVWSRRAVWGSSEPQSSTVLSKCPSGSGVWFWWSTLLNRPFFKGQDVIKLNYQFKLSFISTSCLTYFPCTWDINALYIYMTNLIYFKIQCCYLYIFFTHIYLDAAYC